MPSPARYALIRSADERVTNVVLWDGEAAWQPPAGHYTRASLTAQIGDTWDGMGFTPPAPIVDPDAAPIAAAIAQLKATFNTQRNATQMNNSIDALTVLMRRVFRELQ